jgi:DNA-binding NtrC family response regulator
MPARIVIVHDDADFTRRVTAVLWAAGHEAVVFEDPLLAHDAIEEAQRVEVLITRVRFREGRSNGISLARMTRTKRPGVKVLFVARGENLRLVEGLGTLLPAPTSIESVVALVEQMLAEIDQPSRAAGVKGG